MERKGGLCGRAIAAVSVRTALPSGAFGALGLEGNRQGAAWRPLGLLQSYVSTLPVCLAEAPSCGLHVHPQKSLISL